VNEAPLPRSKQRNHGGGAYDGKYFLDRLCHNHNISMSLVKFAQFFASRIKCRWSGHSTEAERVSSSPEKTTALAKMG
jgi:hypothetical protein